MDFKSFIRPGRGAADIMPLLRDGPRFHTLTDHLAALFAGVEVAKLACVEGRGFLLGSALAYRLGVGLAPVRHAGRLKAAGAVHTVSYADYSRTTKTLEIHADAIAPGERILVVDDWVETGETLKAAIRLVERCGGIVAGAGVLMDGTTPAVRDTLTPYGYRFLLQTAPGDRF